MSCNLKSDDAAAKFIVNNGTSPRRFPGQLKPEVMLDQRLIDCDSSVIVIPFYRSRV